jgi:integrase
MDAVEVAKQYLKDRPVTASHRGSVLRAAGRVGILEAGTINAYLNRRLSERSTITVKTERSILLTLWRYAWENDLVAAAPKGVLRFKSRKPPTRAWTPEQIVAAIEATERHTGRRMWSGASKPLFLKTWLLLGYESGARMGDNFNFTRDNIDGDVLRWVQSKTGDGLCKVLSPECLACVGRMLERSPDGTILRWVCSPRQAIRVMREHLQSCGLPGSSKWLRRSGATHIETQTPGKASLHLGHRTQTLAGQAYLDWGQIRKTTPVVPRLMPQ